MAVDEAPDLDALDPEAPVGFARGDALAGIDGSSEELIEEAPASADVAAPQVDAGDADAPESAT